MKEFIKASIAKPFAFNMQAEEGLEIGIFWIAVLVLILIL